MRGWLLCGALFVVAIVIGWWLGSSDSSPEPSEPPPATPAAPPQNSPAPTPQAPEAPATPDKYALQPIDALLWGRVQTPDGSGIEGVIVAAWPALEAPDEADLVPPLEEATARYEKERVWRDRYVTRATTAADGSFELAGLVAADYEITNNFGAKRKSESLVVPGSFVVFTAQEKIEAAPGVRVFVDNVPTTAKKPTEVIVELADTTDGAAFRSISEARVTTQQGVTQVQLAGSEWQLPLQQGDQVHAVAHDWYGAVMRTPKVAWDGRTNEIALRFPNPNTLSVDVIYPADMEEEVVWIGFLGFDPNGPELSLGRFLQGAQWRHVFSGGNHFDLGFHLPPGHYRIGVSLGKPQIAYFGGGSSPRRPASTGVIAATMDAEVTEGPTTVVLEIPPDDPNDGIYVTVVNHDDPFERDPGLNLTIDTPEESRKRVYSKTEKLADGWFRLHGFDESVDERLSGEVSGSVFVRASNYRGPGDGDHVEVVVQRAEPAHATVVFERRIPVTLIFTGLPEGFDGEEYLRVYEPKYRRWKVADRLSRTQKLPPGEYEINYSVGPVRRNVTSFLLGKLALTVERDAEPIVRTLEIEELHRVELLAPSRRPQRTIGVKDDKERYGGISRGDTPRWMFLPAGTYSIFAEAEMTITVPAASQVDLEKILKESP